MVGSYMNYAAISLVSLPLGSVVFHSFSFLSFLNIRIILFLSFFSLESLDSYRLGRLYPWNNSLASAFGRLKIGTA